MATGKSIFGKAIGFAAGLMGAGAGDAAAQTTDETAARAQAEAEHERILRSLRLVVRDAGYAAHRNRILADRGAQPDDVIFTTPFAKGLELILVADEPTTSKPWMLRDLEPVQGHAGRDHGARPPSGAGDPALAAARGGGGGRCRHGAEGRLSGQPDARRRVGRA